MLGFKMMSHLFTSDLCIVISPPNTWFKLALDENGPKLGILGFSGFGRQKTLQGIL